MKNCWYQIKERSAGEKRLQITWFIYKLFGRTAVDLIAWNVGMGTFLFSQNLRKVSQKYFKILYEYTNNKRYKPSLINSFRHILSYAYSLVDKIEVFSDSASYSFLIEDYEIKKELSLGGKFFITTHTGNIELLRTFLKKADNQKINIFMQKQHCENFNNFINSLTTNNNITVYPVENIGIETAIEIKDKLEQGEFVFMAGDRLSAKNAGKYYYANLFNKKIKLPLGTLKFALMMEAPIILIAALNKGKRKYKIVAEKFTVDNNKQSNLNNLQQKYAAFLEKITLEEPYQFYHYYDFFEE